MKDEEAKFEQMCSSYLGNDIKITKRVVEETSGVVANSRKRDIMNLFTEVQKTQQQLNENLVRELTS